MGEEYRPTEQWAVYDRFGELYPGSVWPERDEAAQRAVIAEGIPWPQLEKGGFRLRIVVVDVAQVQGPLESRNISDMD